MIFALSKLVWLLRPSIAILVVAFAGLALRRRRLTLLALLTYAAIAVTPLGMIALRPLEDRFPPPDPLAAVTGIVVLGGAVETDLSEAHGRAALNWSAERMTEAVALARRYPDARVVFTGGSGALLPGAMSEADAARLLFDALGIDPARVTYEDRSRNTVENAVFTRDLVHPAPSETWLLVTSAMHMPRSVGIFRRIGWPVVAWPVGYKTLHGWRSWRGGVFPDRLEMLDAAMHEYAGLLAYRALGRTDALFPAP